MIKKNGNKKNPLFARNNSIIKARIKLNRTVCMEAFEDVPMLGRFTLRDEGKTIAIGQVIRIAKNTK